MVERPRPDAKEWKGFKFIFLSLLVTTVSITFFFAARHFLININQGAFSASPLTQWFGEVGGIRIRSVEIKVSEVSVPVNLRKEDIVGPYLDQLKEKLSAYQGQQFWFLDLKKLESEVLEYGWVSDVSIQRKFPDTLEVKIDPRVPYFVGRSRSGWVLLDQMGRALSLTDQVSGAWVSLPIIYGFENTFSSGHSAGELNRKLQEEQSILQDLANLVYELKERVGLSIESVTIKKDAWMHEYLFELIWVTEEESGKAFSRAVVFESGEWEDRIQSFQFVLSDLKTKGVQGAQILGQHSGRWFVEKGVR